MSRALAIALLRLLGIYARGAFVLVAGVHAINAALDLDVPLPLALRVLIGFAGALAILNAVERTPIAARRLEAGTHQTPKEDR